MTEGGEQSPREPAPENEGGGQRFMQELRGQQFQAASRGVAEPLRQPRHDRRAELGLSLIVRLDKQMSCGR